MRHVAASGITRKIGTDDAIVLLPNSTLEIEYFDGSGATLSPPLTTTDVRNKLVRVSILLSVTSANNLRSGVPYNSTVRNEIFLRNLHYSRE